MVKHVLWWCLLGQLFFSSTFLSILWLCCEPLSFVEIAKFGTVAKRVCAAKIVTLDRPILGIQRNLAKLAKVLKMILAVVRKIF